METAEDQALDCARQIARLNQALYDLLDTLERGDGYRQRERMAAAGKLLGLQRVRR